MRSLKDFSCLAQLPPCGDHCLYARPWRVGKERIHRRQDEPTRAESRNGGMHRLADLFRRAARQCDAAVDAAGQRYPPPEAILSHAPGFPHGAQPQLARRGAFYLLFVVGLLVFAVVPGLEGHSLRTTLLRAALFGLICYTTYDLYKDSL